MKVLLVPTVSKPKHVYNLGIYRHAWGLMVSDLNLETIEKF